MIQDLTWISFPNLLFNFYVKEALFTLASAVEKPLHLDMAIVNKTRRSYLRVKVQDNLLFAFPKHVNMEIENESTCTARNEKAMIQYDFLSKYCTKCKIQGHANDVCHILHLELTLPKVEKDEEEKKVDKMNH